MRILIIANGEVILCVQPSPPAPVPDGLLRLRECMIRTGLLIIILFVDKLELMASNSYWTSLYDQRKLHCHADFLTRASITRLIRTYDILHKSIHRCSRTLRPGDAWRVISLLCPVNRGFDLIQVKHMHI